ncbi:TonB-dependent receptor [Ichthyenterobacterium sp. W332]|uniref:TonB-dependent receptor n=1 Tax=Microcosmobacter mediterraneus TaxID=3075607 RepID=A0ABU2YKP4_9FLAO|nr:TonB-dependent receptor [Ichthyenterobacterium sp. W332]MDT0557800.1 TonB-dependent receptor [Ichthyenterobacterium sp. W332]
MGLRVCSFLFVFFVFISFSVNAQVITVLEKGTNEPIAGVVLYNINKNKSTSTDIIGNASIDAFDINEIIYFQNILYKKVNITKSQIITNDNTVYLELKVEGLDQVVVSASKFEQDNKDIPQRIISLNAEDIRLANPQTSADALLGTGNVYIQKSQLGGGSPIIRGFSTNRLLISVDGVRMNNAIFRGGNLQNVISIDPFSINNTEITLGSGSVVYGSDAIGGVMSFYTKRPQLSYKDSLYFNTNSTIRYASANFEKTAHVDFNLGYKKWAFLSSVSFTDFNDLRMGNHGPEEYLRPEYIATLNGIDTVVENSEPNIQKPTGYSQFNIMQKIRYEPIDNLNFDFGFFFTKTSDFPRYDRLILDNGNTLRSAEWNYGPQQWLMSNLQVTKVSSRSNFYDKIKATMAYQNFKESRSDRDFQSTLRNRTQESLDAYSFNIDLEKQLSKKSILFYGIEYIFNRVSSQGLIEDITSNNTELTVSRYPDGSTWQSLAAYANYKYKPNLKFVFQTGLRYNQVTTNSDFTFDNQFLNLPFNEAKLNTGALTGSAGFTWLPSKIMQWKFNLSTAFRAPNIDDIGKVFDSEPGSVVVPNDDLRPEYSVGGDLGLQLNLNTVKLDFNTYYTFLDNALIRRDFNLNGETQIIYNGELSNVQAIQNASKTWIYGFEAAIEVKLSDLTKLRSQYNIIGGTEEDENGVEVPVRHVAPAFGSTHIIWNKNRLNIDAFAQYNGELSFNQLAPSEQNKAYLYAEDANGNPYSPSWYTLNIRSSYQLNDQFSVTAALENITDQRYRTYSSGISAPGRNLILSLHYNL